MKKIKLDRYLWHGGRDGDALLVQKWKATILGVTVWVWYEHIRIVPVWEWAKFACLGDGIFNKAP